ncbi:hypothetical protein DOS74_00855 [Staphylococcus felis]|uniref:Uncharacterized protein n=1 Tax=Staphylococcus felis TaxID=46127 RepID=A0AAX1RW24_9STAP|nr:hypothetical protein DOS56_06815 [Staphylococcus felis]REH84545.1 hypothetical protein DOS63_06700 [Staphylococcus felis]REI17024.1 hypothetical protein DOS75_05685 [Staphylococcus felis]REI18636.1 hypothetical protein DOS74_00855 [Staphylococcus felis]REI21724.1 hypothetical protein DOS76_06390 [Staphylococcus felis]
MQYSLFRFIDFFEICILYIVCFVSKTLLLNIQIFNLSNSFILQSFLQSILEYHYIIVILSSFVIIIFHYQFLARKKTEVFCRILVGSTMIKIIRRYILDSLCILLIAFLISLILNFYLKLDIKDNFYLVCIFIIYIIICASQVKKNENF